MQQRSLNSFRVAAEDQCIISQLPESRGKHSPRRRSFDDSDSILPIYGRKRDDWKQKLAEKSVHVIPFVVLLAFIILWWFSSPVNLKDGIVAKAYPIELPQPLNYTHIELATLGAATMQNASVPLNLTSNDTAIHEAFQVR